MVGSKFRNCSDVTQFEVYIYKTSLESPTSPFGPRACHITKMREAVARIRGGPERGKSQP